MIALTSDTIADYDALCRPPCDPLMPPRLLGTAALFYGVLVLAAAAIGALPGRNVFALGGPLAPSLALGVATACGTVALGLLAYKAFPVFRKLSEELAPLVVDGARRRDLLLLAAFSGVGEEALFRGALQPEIGIVAASLLFGALHVGPDRRYLLWTLWAVGAGFLFGALYEWTGGILAPVVAHALHNAATLLLWKHSRKAGGAAFGEAA